jgi:NADH-quinone oxidoreductase subunit M
MNTPILLITAILLPLAGAVVLLLVGSRDRRVVRPIALIVTLTTLVAAGVLVANFPADGHLAEPFAASETSWLGAMSGMDVRFSVALDGLSLWLFALSALLMVSAVLVSWEAIHDRAASFYGMLLLLECGCLGVFAARDIILFYVFFEFTLIPLFFLIGIWGSEQRRYAAIKFFLFTLAGSVLTFLGLLAIVIWVFHATGQLTFAFESIEQGLAEHPLPSVWQLWIFLALFAGFAIKVPLFPLHTWLPLAHVQAPTAGSVILAGILLKIGTYGFVRFNLPMLPDATAVCAPWMMWLSVAGIIYGALVALAQSDIKRLIAYSSVSHLGFCMLGLFALNQLGLQGSVLQMINHGISTGGLFAIVGMMYERYHTRQINELGGIARRTPVLAMFMLVFTLSSIGLPGMNGFAGEFLILAGAFQRGWATAPEPLAGQLQIISVLAVAGVVLGAWYMLWLVQRVFFGPLSEPTHDADAPPIRDLSFREVAALAPLVVFIFWIGLQPGFFVDRIGPTLAPIATRLETQLQLKHGVPERVAVETKYPMTTYSLTNNK